MKVPMLEPQVNARGVATYSPELVRPDRFGSEAIRSVGHDFALASEQVQKNYAAKNSAAEKAQEEANALVSAKASLAAEDAAGKAMLEFRKKQGLAASEGRADAYKAVDEAWSKVGEGIVEPGARSRFTMRSYERRMEYHRQIDGHTLEQFNRDRTEVVKARVGQALGAAEAGDSAQHGLADQVEADIQSNYPGASGPMVEKFRADMAFARLRATAKRGDVAGAFEFVNSDVGRKQLAGNYEEAVNFVAQAKKGSDIEEAKGAAAGYVGEILKHATTPDGYVDRAKAEAELFAVPQHAQLYAKTILAEQLRAADDKKKQDINGWKTTARATFDKTHQLSAIPGDVVERLDTYAADSGDYMHRLRVEAAAWDKAQRVKSGGSKSEKSALAKEQLQRDRIAEYEFRAQPRADQATADVDEFVTGRGVSAEMKAKLGMLKGQSKEYSDKGFGVLADRFVAEAESSPLFKGKHALTPEKHAEYRTAAAEVFDDFVKKNERAPNAAERKALLAPLEADVVTSKGWLFDTRGKGFQVPADQRPPAPAPMTQPVTPTTAARVAAERVDPKRAAAMKWLAENPNDPRAAAMRRKLGL